mmetsp:Transcript_81051/g.229510  ORF Transcript_81051/g.229510 Transcript_81051/m.229510 type:complete len:331 (-) Transcript_81051:88-1080(-)
MAACLVPPSPSAASGRRLLTPGNTTMRRRVLHSAALGEWAAVREAVETEGCGVNIRDVDSGLSLVHWAAHQGDEEHIRWLIGHGAVLRPRDSRGEPPLTGARGAARELLLQEAYSPVERALYMRGPPTAERLEALLANLEPAELDAAMEDEDGATLALALAQRHGGAASGQGEPLDAAPLLRWLSAHGADMEATDQDGNTLLHMVDWEYGADAIVPLVQWALMEANVQHKDLRNHDGWTPAALCASHSPSGADALRGLELLEAAGANLSLGNAKGMNAAMALARYQGDGPWLEWCYTKAGVEPSARCARGRTVADYLKLYGEPDSEDEES